MSTSNFGVTAKVGLGLVALLSLLVVAMGALQARPVEAANGDPVLVYGGSVAGSGAQNVTIAPGASGNYVVSMTVPAGEDISGIDITILYDATKFSSVTCTASNTSGEISVCNPADDPGKAKIINTKLETTGGPPPTSATGWGPGTHTLATLHFTVANAAPNTANAISSFTIVDCSAVGAPGDTAVNCPNNAGNVKALVIGAAPSFPWGDVNCSGSVTSTDISIIVLVSAGGTRPGSCTQPTDLNCSGSVTSTDISIVVFIAAGGVFNLPPACLAPLAYAPAEASDSHTVMASSSPTWEAI